MACKFTLPFRMLRKETKPYNNNNGLVIYNQSHVKLPRKIENKIFSSLKISDGKESIANKRNLNLTANRHSSLVANVNSNELMAA